MRLVILSMLASLFLVIFQTSIAPFFQIGIIRADGFCALVTWLAVEAPFIPSSLLAVLIAGASASMASVAAWYSYPAAFFLAYLIVSYNRIGIMDFTYLHRILLTCLAAFIIELFLFMSGGNLEGFWPWGLMQSLFNMLLAPLFFTIFHSVSSMFQKIGNLRRTENDQETI